ncbi:hypothetical protein K402DRAFT_396882 [Aulographum hederae CBS 113979]|uniref:BRCT domain-containing protein n=1 Tax=Aulographum hederae CBS 113979 TaxID=1176131 RepID=A0A6G1GQT7_9PEZI|nr:hypothetical protein K402DRAFT_396882 [Aulographum hederae CBS 113979]
MAPEDMVNLTQTTIMNFVLGRDARMVEVASSHCTPTSSAASERRHEPTSSAPRQTVFGGDGTVPRPLLTQQPAAEAAEEERGKEPSSEEHRGDGTASKTPLAQNLTVDAVALLTASPGAEAAGKDKEKKVETEYMSISEEGRGDVVTLKTPLADKSAVGAALLAHSLGVDAAEEETVSEHEKSGGIAPRSPLTQNHAAEAVGEGTETETESDSESEENLSMGTVPRNPLDQKLAAETVEEVVAHEEETETEFDERKSTLAQRPEIDDVEVDTAKSEFEEQGTNGATTRFFLLHSVEAEGANEETVNSEFDKSLAISTIQNTSLVQNLVVEAAGKEPQTETEKGPGNSTAPKSPLQPQSELESEENQCMQRRPTTTAKHLSSSLPMNVDIGEDKAAAAPSSYGHHIDNQLLEVMDRIHETTFEYPPPQAAPEADMVTSRRSSVEEEIPQRQSVRGASPKFAVGGVEVSDAGSSSGPDEIPSRPVNSGQTKRKIHRVPSSSSSSSEIAEESTREESPEVIIHSSSPSRKRAFLVDGELAEPQKRSKMDLDAVTQDSILSNVVVATGPPPSKKTSQKKGSGAKKAKIYSASNRMSRDSASGTLDDTAATDRIPWSSAPSGASQGLRGHHAVVFTGSEVPNSEATVRWLRENSVRILEKVSDDTVLCVGKGELKKTSKLLIAFALGCPIVRDEWATKSWRAKKLVDIKGFLPKSPKMEKEWGFKMSDTVGKGRQRLFKGKTVYMTPGLKRDYGGGYKDVVKIIQACGGSVISKAARNLVENDDTIVIGLEDGDRDAEALAEDGWTCYSKEILSLSIIRGELDLEDDEFVI